MSFFAELKRRNVLRAAAFYAASTWLLVQVATQVFPFFHIAEWVVRWIVIASIIGFPFAMLFSWVYEWTPQGLQRESAIPPNESITRQAGKKLDRWITVILALAVVLLLADKLVLPKAANPGSDKAATSDKSIAVLPFLNMSSDKEQDYFSDGLSEELLNQLAQIPQLRVIARTSSFSFKGKEVDVATIAKALNVANVLEGSVRKSANTLRITAQLVRTSDSSNLWSQTYERQMTDVFKVQDEIAGDVVAALKVKLLPTQQLTKTQRTGNPEAYEHYLLGIDISRRDRLEASQLAAAEFQKAITLDPGLRQCLCDALDRASPGCGFGQQPGAARRGDQAGACHDRPGDHAGPGPGFGLHPSRIPSLYSRLGLARRSSGFQTSPGAGSQ